jgi:hypothetical protein
MKKALCVALVVLFMSFYAKAEDKVPDIIKGTLCTGVATWSWIEVSKSNSSTKVYVDFIGVYFTVKAVFHFAKAIVE